MVENNTKIIVNSKVTFYRRSMPSCSVLLYCPLAFILGSPPPYGRSQGSGSTGLPPFSCEPCRRPTRSQCGPPWVISEPMSPPEGFTPFYYLWNVIWPERQKVFRVCFPDPLDCDIQFFRFDTLLIVLQNGLHLGCGVVWQPLSLTPPPPLLIDHFVFLLPATPRWYSSDAAQPSVHSVSV